MYGLIRVSTPESNTLYLLSERKQTCGVCNLHTQNEDESSIIRTSQVIADKSTHTMMSRDEAKSKGADQIRDQENENEYASSILEAIVEVNAGQN